MALVPVGSKAIVAAEQNYDRLNPKKPVNVLDEDEYIEIGIIVNGMGGCTNGGADGVFIETDLISLEKIITKDFFPDLPKLQAQSEYLDALERKDVQKIWQLQHKFSQKRTALRTPSIYGTPSTFDTPETRLSSTPARTGEKLGDAQDASELQKEGPTHNPEPGAKLAKSLEKTTLDKFLAKNTSEDNMSFVDIMEEAEQKQRLKNSWLYEKLTEQLEKKEQSLALPSLEKQAIEPAVSGVNTWTYVLRNSVMYVPDGVAASPEEAMERAGKCREIVHKNTRLSENPFNSDRSKECLTQAASAQAKVQPGRIGPDGKEILPSQSPKIGGYGFVGTPSPAPGVDASPLMTWGEIEGTPFRLDGSDTPLTGGSSRGPVFKIPDVPRRDRLLHELAEKTSKAHRDKKEKALKQATASFSSPSPKLRSSKSDRLQFLSPAAQSLASKKLGIRMNSDKELQASYTPSPTASRTPDIKTPILSPCLSSVRSTREVTTPSTGCSGGSRTPGQASKNTASTSLTDNLLHLPKRAKAQEFF